MALQKEEAESSRYTAQPLEQETGISKSQVNLALNRCYDVGLVKKEVAEYLKLAEKTAYRLAAEGKLPGSKVGGSWRFRREDVQSWINSQKTGSGKNGQKG